MFIHSCLQGGGNIFRKSVGRHRDDRHSLGIFNRQGADRFSRFQAIHNGHLDIHQYQGIGPGRCGFKFIQPFQTVFGGGDIQSGIF